MEIRKMTCPKCGGAVKLNGDLAGGVCPSCGMSFGLGSAAPLTVPEAKPAVSAPTPEADDYRPGAPAVRGRLSASDERREAARREEAARAAEEANRAAKEASLSEKDPVQASLTAQRLKTAFRAINAKQWMRADAILNDILKAEPSNEEALRGKRLVAAHKTDQPEAASAEANRAAEPAAAVPESAEKSAPVVAVTPVLVPETETGRRAESEIADTDRRMAARLSDSIDRKRNQKLLNKSNRALLKKKWKKADAYANEILKSDPESAYAYRNKLLAELKLPEERYLAEYEGNLSEHGYFLLALNYSTGALNSRLVSYADVSTRCLAIRELDRFSQAEAETSRRIAEINASLPDNYNDEAAEKERNKRISKILDRADALREKKKWAKAKALYQSALEVDGECADAYLGLLLVSLKLNQEKKLAHCKEPFGTDPNFLLAMHYGSRVMRRRLKLYLESAGQNPPASADELIILPAAAPSAAGTEIEELRADMNRHLEGIERLLLYGGYGERGLSPEELLRLPAAESNADRYATELCNTERKLAPIFRRARKLHKRKKYERAATVYNEILALDPTNRDAYVGKLLCDLRLKKEKKLVKSRSSFSSDECFILAVRFSSPEETKRLEKAASKVDRRLGVKDAKSNEKSSRAAKKRKEEYRSARRDAITQDAERRTKETRIAGTHLRPKEEDKALAEAERYIKRDKYKKAKPILDDLIAHSPDFAGAYLARLLCTCSCRKPSELGKVSYPFRDNPDYILAYYFGKRKTRKRLTKYAAKAEKRAKKAGGKVAAEWADIENAELADTRREQETLNRIAGNHAEQRRVQLDAPVVKTTATAPGHRLGQSKSEHKQTVQKGYDYLRRKKWNKARACFEQVRNDNPSDCAVYVGLLLVSLGLREQRELAKAKTTFSENRYYQLALCCADIKTAALLRDYAARADRLYGKMNDPTPVTYTEYYRRSEELKNRRISELEKKNNDLEAELARRGESSRVGAAFADDDSDYYLHDGGRFAALKVALFLLGITLTVALVGALALFIFRFHGNFSEMIEAIKNAFGK